MSWSKRILALAVAASCSACAHRPPPPLHTARLVVQRGAAGMRAYVKARVAGRPVLLLLDSGACQSIVPVNLLRGKGLEVGYGGGWYTDANGTLFPTVSVSDVPVQFDGESAGGTMDLLATNALSDPETGIIAPQDLVRPGWALVIDLERGELSYELEEAALKRLGDGQPLRPTKAHSCLAEGLFEKCHRIVSTRINGIPAKMLVDTGAVTTALARNNPALPSMAAVVGNRGRTEGMASKGQHLMVDGVTIEFSEIPFRVPAMVLPASQTCWQGAIGADVLSHCTLVWGWDSLWAACRTSSQAKPPGAGPASP